MAPIVHLSASRFSVRFSGSTIYVQLAHNYRDPKVGYAKPKILYNPVRDNLEVKEVVVGEGEARKRYVVVRNPKQVERDREQRQEQLEQLAAEIARLNHGRPRGEQGRREHTKAVCALKTHRTLGRFVRELKSGELRIDRQKVKAEERLDGKYLVITSDDSLSSQDVALCAGLQATGRGGERLAVAEGRSGPAADVPPQGGADPRACAGLLVGAVAGAGDGGDLRRELALGAGCWVRQEMNRLHGGVLEAKDGWFVQRTELTYQQRQYLKALAVAAPPRFEEIRAQGPEVELAPS